MNFFMFQPYTEEDDELESILFVSSDEEEISDSSPASTTELSSDEPMSDISDSEDQSSASAKKISLKTSRTVSNKTSQNEAVSKNTVPDSNRSNRRSSLRNKSEIEENQESATEEHSRTRSTRYMYLNIFV